MDFEMVVKKRRMCREYLDRDVPSEKVDRILDLASRYPSAGHIEPQEFVVVRDREVKEALAHAALGHMFVAQALLVIVVVSDIIALCNDIGPLCSFPHPMGVCRTFRSLRRYA